MDWLLVVLVVTSSGVATRPVEKFPSVELCRQAQDAEYRVGLYVPLKDGTGRLLYCAPRPR